MAELKFVVDTSRLEQLIMGVADDFAAFRTELADKLNEIDDRMEALEAAVTAGNDARTELAALGQSISDARASLASVDVNDPSGDDPQPPAA